MVVEFAMWSPEAKHERKLRDGDRDRGGDKGNEFNGSFTPVLGAPAHLLARVFSHLDCIALLNRSLVCKQWYMYCAELREAWKNEYFETWTLSRFCNNRGTHPPCSTCSMRGAHSWCF